MNAQASADEPGARAGAILAAVIVALALYRLLVQLTTDATLFSDEAYYWGWAQSFEWGYYSKPPVLAWIVGATTALLGDGPTGIRAGLLVLHPLTAAAIFALARGQFGARAALFGAIAYLTLPAVSVSSLFLTTDAPLLLFWTLALWGFRRALETDAWRWWVLAGAAAGGGLMSKYTMGLFAPCALIYLLLAQDHRRHLRNPRLYAAVLIAAALFAPNVWWNWQHQFATVRHTQALTGLGALGLHFGSFFGFLGGQFLVFGPLLFAAFLAAAFRRSLLRDDRFLYLFCFSVPVLLFVAFNSLMTRAYLNWAAPAGAAGTVLAIAWLAQKQHTRMLWAALGLNAALMIGFYHYHAIASGLGAQLTRHQDPYARMRGWDRLGEDVSRLLAQHPGARLLSDERNLMAELVYYVRPHPVGARYWTPPGALDNQYQLDAPLTAADRGPFLYVTYAEHPAEVLARFGRVQALGRITIPLYPDSQLAVSVFVVEDFRGYGG